MNITFYSNNPEIPETEITVSDSSLPKLIYRNKNFGKLMEFCGRTCYNSIDKITKDSYIKFISGICKSGHESVLEHSNMIYIVPYNRILDSYLASTIFENNKLIDYMSFPNDNYIIFRGNLRMFKDLCRSLINNSELSGQVAAIWESFKSIPTCYFADFKNILYGTEDNPVLETEEIIPVKLSDYVDLLYIDDIESIKINDKFMKKGKLNKLRIMTLRLKEPRFITHQEVRHRMSSYSQESQRYCNYSHNDCYLSPEVEKYTGARDLVSKAIKMYGDMIEFGIKKEDARAILPEGMMSTICVTRTIEEWKRYCSLRTSERAQAFIREEIAKPIDNFLKANT